jgi:hypothetical protein
LGDVVARLAEGVILGTDNGAAMILSNILPAEQSRRLNRVRLVSDGTLGTIIDRNRGWLTIQWDGAPTPCDVHAPLSRGIVEKVYVA